MFSKKIKSAIMLASYACISHAAGADQEPGKSTPKSLDSGATLELDEVIVKAKRRRIITPLPGLPIDRETATTNIQTANDMEIAESKALNVTDFLNSNMQSVNVNDYSGNPFQQDLNFRGFTASPQIGTAEGISVYLDGVRINEPFGEVVNWDLIPMNALAGISLIPGSSPMFGLNTLGGALAITTKSGFTDHSLRAQQLGGAWGRQQTQFSNGIHGDTFALFTAYNHFKEDGWRVNSPSNLRQLFNKATARFDAGEINFTALNVDTSLTGNGVAPVEMLDYDREQVFTSPDQAKNNLEHYSLGGTWYVNDKVSLSGVTYRRNLKQNAIGTDVYQGYYAFQSALQIQTADLNGDNLDDLLGQLNGVLNQSSLDSKSNGFSLQMTYEGDKHQIAGGISLDENKIAFMQSQTLGALDSQHAFMVLDDPYLSDPGNALNIQTSLPGVIRNNLHGTSKVEGVFATDTWSPIDTLHITYGARMNWAHVKNTLVSDRAADFYQFQNGGNGLNALNDPARQVCSTGGSSGSARFICSEGDYKYRSFNPSIGATWEVTEHLTTYGNISQGSRVPSVIELGCAKDHEGREGNSTNFQYGCSIPTSLSADPYLKQVRSTAYETGMRGSADKLEWNIGVFKTDLVDDILFVPLGQKNRGVFDNFGRTRRAGVEMGFKGNWGNSTFGINYTWLKATYESSAQIINDANSTNSSVTTNQAYVNVEPGDQLPGMPNHIFQANWNYKFTPAFDMTLNMVAHSFSYVRGNENNEHSRRAATLYDIPEPGFPNGDGLPDRDLYDYTGSGRTAGYAVFNLRANYKFNDSVTMFVRVDNLFDKSYATAGSLGRNPFTPQGAFQVADVLDANGNPQRIDKDWSNSTFITPGAPRAAWVGLSFDWDWDKVKKSKILQELD